MSMVKTIDSERLKTELLGMRRWEDEGGQMIEDNDSSSDPIIIQQPAAIHARRRVLSRCDGMRASSLSHFGGVKE